MSWYKKAQIEQDEALRKHLEMIENSYNSMGIDFTDSERGEATKRFNRKFVGEEIKEKPVTITLYRNFDANMSEMIKDDNGNLILSPKKCEQGVLWFAHSLQSNPQQYYDRGGKYLLTYPLQATYRYLEKVYDDGSTSQEPITEGDIGTDDSSTWAGYKLPDGFEFSYKTQKHIICRKDLFIPQNYITEADNELV